MISNPVPAHSVHLSLMYIPLPLQVRQVDCTTIVSSFNVSNPLPLQNGQTIGFFPQSVLNKNTKVKHKLKYF